MSIPEPTTKEVDTSAIEDLIDAAPAALTSLIAHLILLIVLGLLVASDRNNGPVVLEISQADDGEFSLETPSVELADLIEPPQQTETIEIVELDAVDLGEIADPLKVEELPDFFDSVGAEPSEVVVDTRDLMEEQFASVEGVSVKFGKEVQYAQKNGLDIVIVFDSTGSMGSEIEAVKRRIGDIGKIILRKIPSARFSLVTYRDVSDRYLVRGMPLTKNISDVNRFIVGVSANGGGDAPEAVQAGMEWAMTRLYFGEKSKKAMLIFGDAPPHIQDLPFCLKMARIFNDRGGEVSTITCRSRQRLPEFYKIAEMGGGESYTMTNAHRIMEELLIMAFGREHREDVLKFFELDGNAPRFN